MAQTDCPQYSLDLQDLGSRKVQANFQGGHLSSDGGGAVFLREVEQRCGLIKGLARCFEDRRDPELIEHPVADLLSQRINGLILGYEDLNDHDDLRRDPALAYSVGKSDLEGKDRRDPNDKGKALAAHATLNRLELAAENPDSRYKKIVADPTAIEDFIIDQGVKAIPKKSKEIIIDFDATDDPLHGKQEGAYFHGYYRHYCYLPLYAFCGNIPLWSELRESNIDGCQGTVEALQKMIPAIRKRFGKKVRIILRGDGGFAREEIMAWCESQTEVYYCLGYSVNSRLEKGVRVPLWKLRQEAAEAQKKAEADQINSKEIEVETSMRRFTELRYCTKDSWSRERRVIAKLELLPGKTNLRFIVTNLPGEGFENDCDRTRFRSQSLYEDFYCARGEMENRIKEQQMDLFADRTSTHWMASNQLRLWFSVIAHIIMNRLKACVLKGTELEKATIGQIRIKLFKMAVRITVSCRRVLMEFVSSFPRKKLFGQCVGNLGNLDKMPA